MYRRLLFTEHLGVKGSYFFDHPNTLVSRDLTFLITRTPWPLFVPFPVLAIIDHEYHQRDSGSILEGVL
jgi:hypothetical protein